MRIALPVVRWLLAAIFLWAGVAKGFASNSLVVTLTPFTILPSSWIGPIAFTLPWVEIVGGILLLLAPKIGATITLGLSLLFSAMLGWALWNGIIVACSCFGTDATPSAAKMALALTRDVFLAGASLFVLLRNGCRNKPGTLQKTPASASDE